MNRKLALVFLLVIASCQLVGKKSNGQDDMVVKSGYSFGFCVGYCKAEMTIDGPKQSLVQASHGRSTDPPDKTIEIDLDLVKYDAIQRAVDLDVFCSLDETYGCPDCADGGAEHVILPCNGIDKKVTIEYGATLPPIQNLLDHLRPLRDSLVVQLND